MMIAEATTATITDTIETIVDPTEIARNTLGEIHLQPTKKKKSSRREDALEAPATMDTMIVAIAEAALMTEEDSWFVAPTTTKAISMKRFPEDTSPTVGDEGVEMIVIVILLDELNLQETLKGVEDGMTTMTAMTTNHLAVVATIRGVRQSFPPQHLIC